MDDPCISTPGVAAGLRYAVEMRRLRDLTRLIHDAVDHTTHLVAEGHESAARAVMRVLDVAGPLAGPAHVVDDLRRLATAGVLGGVRAVNRGVAQLTDLAADAAESIMDTEHKPEAVALRSDVTGSARWLADAALGALNGAVGDHLYTRKSSLDLGLVFRHGDTYLTLTADALARQLPAARPKLALFVHGLGTTEWSWCIDAAKHHGDASVCFGSLLERDLGYVPIYVCYNTGRHTSENGQRLARALAELVAAYPTAIEEIVLIGHSMGGLVVRSACHYAEVEGLAWTKRVRHVFCLGTPHHGAPLERLGHLATAVLGAVDTPGTRIPALLLQGRSAGIKDLRHGTIVDEDWDGSNSDARNADMSVRVPLLAHAKHHFLSATVTREVSHPLGWLAGDLLVRVPSATGAHLEGGNTPVEIHHIGGVMHHQMQNHPAVYEAIRAALAAPHSDGK